MCSLPAVIQVCYQVGFFRLLIYNKGKICTVNVDDQNFIAVTLAFLEKFNEIQYQSEFIIKILVDI